MVGITAVAVKHAVTTEEIAMRVQVAFLNTHSDAMHLIKKEMNVIQIPHEPTTIPLDAKKYMNMCN